jgi:hypothetical protein
LRSAYRWIAAHRKCSAAISCATSQTPHSADH